MYTVHGGWAGGAPMIHSAVRTVLCSLLMSDFVAEPNLTVIEVHRIDSMMAEYNCFSSSCGRLNFLSWEVQPLSMWVCHFRSWEIWMTPLQSQCCPWCWVGGVQGAFSWSQRSSPLFWACSAPGCCDCTRQPALLPPICNQINLRPWWGRRL